MCGAPDQAAKLPPGTDLSKETVLTGRVVAGGEPVGGAFVRLLDGSGEFTAEVVSSGTGRSSKRGRLRCGASGAALVTGGSVIGPPPARSRQAW